jgi:hypothetical protein
MSVVEHPQAPPHSFSGSLAAIGGLLTAVAGLLTILWQIGVLGPAEGTLAQTVSGVSTESAQVVTSNDRAYGEQLARLLRNSADTRIGLGTLISGVQGGSLDYADAKARIAAVIAQRQGLRDDVARMETPARFAGAAELLRRSLTAAIDDDVAVQRWIVAHYEGDPAAEGPAWNDQVAASGRATRAKREFLDAYATLAGADFPALPESY